MEKKENNSAEQEGLLYASLPPPFFLNKKNGNIESWKPMHYEAGLYSVGCKEMIAVDEAVFWSTSRDELTRS